MACYTGIGNSVAQVSMPLGSYKLSTLERDLQVHVANIDRWGGGGRVNGLGASAESGISARRQVA